MTLRLREILRSQRARADAQERELGRPQPFVFFGPTPEEFEVFKLDRARVSWTKEWGGTLGDGRKAWQDAVRRAGFGKMLGRRGPWSSPLVPHDLRRTRIMQLEEAGCPRNAGMLLVGHTSEATFSRYAVTTKEALQRAAELIEARREPAEAPVAAPAPEPLSALIRRLRDAGEHGLAARDVGQRHARAVELGISASAFHRGRAVLEAAEQDPKRFGDLVEMIDRTRNIGRAFAELEARRAQQ